MDKKILSPQDLKAVKDKAKADIDLRDGEKDLRIVMHMGTCGIASGARDVLEELIGQLEQARVETVTLRTSGCKGLCDREPMFTLIDKRNNEFCYGRLDKQKIAAIIQRHVLKNEPVPEYLVTD